MNRIEDQANYYKNIPLRNRKFKSVIHVENTDDINFWQNQLKTVLPGEYYFIAFSRSASGAQASGCEQCLRFRPYLNRNFFICIDSDLRILRHETGLDAEHFIAQTYAYSWENHYCEKNYLQERFNKKIEGSPFSFISFLNSFSELLYNPLVLLVNSATPELNKLWNIKKFNQCIPLQPSREELADNGKLYLKKVEARFDEAFSSLSSISIQGIDSLNPQNAYLHMQGHHLYNLISHIGSLICKGTGIKFTSQILNSFHCTFGYEEIDRVHADLRYILSQKED